MLTAGNLLVLWLTPALAEGRACGHHSRHLQLHPKSQMGLVGWGDSGKRLFSYQRVTTDIINCEHLCLWKMNRDILPHPSQGLTSGVPTSP